MKKIMLTLSACAVLLTLGNQALAAGQNSSSTQYSINVTTACSIISPASVSFGTTSAGAAAQPGLSAGTIQITCSPNVDYRWGVNEGLHYGAPSHFMANGTSLIGYQLKDGTELLGDVGLNALEPTYTETTTENAHALVTSSGAADVYPLTADIAPVPANAVGGVHTDTVQYTVTF